LIHLGETYLHSFVLPEKPPVLLANLTYLFARECQLLDSLRLPVQDVEELIPVSSQFISIKPDQGGRIKTSSPINCQPYHVRLLLLFSFATSSVP
jgi:hypothetical protein